MKIVKNLSLLTCDQLDLPLGITIGNFDGVHKGHQAVLSEVLKYCQKNKLHFAVMTFVPHPRKILNPDHKAFLINSMEERREFMAAAGVDYLIEVDFSRDFSTTNACDFLQNSLFGSQTILSDIFLGHDFAFGAGKSGGHQLVLEFCQKLDPTTNGGLTPKVHLMDERELLGQAVNSSIIRKHLAMGEMEQVQNLLGRPFFRTGIVTKGQQRGTSLGFPTANINCDEDLIVPTAGVYIGKARHKGQVYQALTNIGQNPTFNDDGLIKIETHILNFNQNIYGEYLRVYLLKKIRNEIKFENPNQLKSQIEEDLAEAKTYFSAL